MEQIKALRGELARRCPSLELRTDEPMAKYTTFRVGGPAALMALPKTEEEARAALQAARDAGLSLGKYRAYLALSALDPTVTQDQAGEMTMGELQQCIDACQGHGSGQGQTAGETAAGQQTGTQEPGGHHGQGHGHGHE